jgi:hypothetical protein
MSKIKTDDSRIHSKSVDDRRFGEVNARIVNKMRNMSKKELFASLVATGIYTNSGKLTKEYGGMAHAKK